MPVDRDDTPIGNPLAIGGAPGMTPGMVGTPLDNLDPDDPPLGGDDELADLADAELSNGAADGE